MCSETIHILKATISALRTANLKASSTCLPHHEQKYKKTFSPRPIPREYMVKRGSNSSLCFGKKQKYTHELLFN